MSEANRLAAARLADARVPNRHERNAAINTMRDAGRTLEEIGQHFGLTRERVRQLTVRQPKTKTLQDKTRARLHVVMRGWLWSAGYRKCCTCKTWSNQFTKDIHTCRTCNRLRRQKKQRPIDFLRVMRGWLWFAGYRRCADCHVWSNEVGIKKRLCNECNRKKTRAYYATEHGRAVQAKWQKENPDKTKLYAQRWLAKSPQKKKEYHDRWLSNHPGYIPPSLVRPAYEPNPGLLLDGLRSILSRRKDL